RDGLPRLGRDPGSCEADAAGSRAPHEAAAAARARRPRRSRSLMELGYALSSEEHRPADLVRYAGEAEEAGFSFALISDHFHPWTGTQGQSPFVWSVIGAIAEGTERLRLGTGVTCPIIRIH